MKRVILGIALFFLVSLNTFAQKHEIGIGINTGYSFFRGSGSESTSFINDNTYTNSPLGKKFMLSYGIGVDYKYVFRSNLLLGLEVAYEDLRTKVDIDGYTSYEPEIHPISGRTILHNYFLNASPLVGYRFNFGDFSLDALGGFDVAYSLDTEEKAKYRDLDGNKIQFTYGRKDSYIDLDIRPKIRLNANYKQYTVYASASFGLMDYYKDWDGSNDAAYLNTIRLGIQYRISYK